MALLISGCLSVLAWFLTLSKHLFRTAPLYTVSSVVVLLLSQVFQIAAFLLPLKVMILLGSYNVPRYFPQILAGVERERLILLLAVAAVVLYLAHLLMDFIGAALARNGSVKVIEFELEGETGEKRQRIALNLYRRFVIVLGGATFCLVVMAFLGAFRLATLGIIVSYFVGVIVLSELLFICVPRLLEYALAQFARLIDILSASGFLLVFSSLVVDFLYGHPEGLLLGILALLLSRQMFSRLAMALKNLERLYLAREKTSAALLRPKSLIDESYQDDEEEDALSPGLLDGGPVPGRKARSHKPYWDMVSPEQSGPLLKEMLAKLGASIVDVNQLDAGLRGQLLLHVIGKNSDQVTTHFLFRLFHNNHTQSAMREVELLSVYPGGLCQELLTNTECNNFQAHLYGWVDDAVPVSDALSMRACREIAFIESSAWAVPHKLLQAGNRSSLVERCNHELWLRCQVFSRWMDRETQRLIDSFVIAPERLSNVLGELPLRVYNPDLRPGHVYATKSGFKVAWWGGWYLEPVGSGWPLELGFDRFSTVYDSVCNRCEELRSIPVLQVYIAALAFDFERLCNEGFYLDAFARLREIHSFLEQLER